MFSKTVGQIIKGLHRFVKSPVLSLRENSMFLIKKIKLCSLLCLLVSFHLGFSSFFSASHNISLETEQIQAVLDEFTAQGGKINGSLLVAQGNDIIFAKGFGFADDIIGQFNDVNTKFLIASITKQFTAAAVLKALYEREKVLYPEFCQAELVQKVVEALHQPLIDYLPINDPAWGGDAPKWLKVVTLHHLMCHSSGIPNFADVSNTAYYQEFYQTEHTSIYEVVNLFKWKDLEFIPGERWSYSDSGYVLLGLVVERISGLPINEALFTFFFEPLCMKSTVFLTRGNVFDLKKMYPDLARGYCWDIFENGKLMREQENYEEMLYPHGAGAIMSTARDLHLWNIALYDNHTAMPEGLVNLMRSLHIKVDADVAYGYGLFVSQDSQLPYVFHSGRIPGYRAKLYYYQKQRITVVWLRNIDVNMNQVRKVLEDVDEQFKNFDHTKEPNELITRYLQEKYPLLLEQEKWHDFGTPIINFLESQLSQIIDS